MEILLITLFILLGSFFAFLSSILSSLSQDDISELCNNNQKKGDKLQSLKIHSEDCINSFFLFENFLYALTFTLAGLSVFYIDFRNWLYFVFSIIIIFGIILLLRNFFSSLGRRYYMKAAPRLIPFMQYSVWLASPVISFIRFMNRKIGGQNHEEASREELSAMVETAREDGSIEDDEYRILKNIMHFSEVLVADVMTPRTVIFSCEADKTVGEIVNLPEIQMYSRFPIWDGESLDDGVVGYVMSKDALHAALAGKSARRLRELARPVYFIPENAELDNALDRFLERRQHLLLVVDEYGGVEGLITMEDVLETILGVEIVDEADKVVDLREVAKHRRDKRIAQFLEQNENNPLE